MGRRVCSVQVAKFEYDTLMRCNTLIHGCKKLEAMGFGDASGNAKDYYGCPG